MLSSIIQVIFFDLGDTLVRIKLEILQDICRTIGEKRGRPLEIHEYMADFRAEWSNHEIKNITTRAQELVYWRGFFYYLMKNLGVPNIWPLIEKHADIYSDPASFECFEDVHNVLPELKARGYKLGLISNAFPSAVSIIHELKLRDYFDHKYTFLSFEIPDKYIKPEPEIYKLASRKANVDIGHTLFVDDRWSFVKAALDVGMQAYLIERFSEENKQLVTKTLVPRIYDLYELTDRIPGEMNEKKPAPSLPDAKLGNEDGPSTIMPAGVFAPT
jgi:HAD superfamily hydrolase (TIGR01509 family)